MYGVLSAVSLSSSKKKNRYIAACNIIPVTPCQAEQMFTIILFIRGFTVKPFQRSVYLSLGHENGHLILAGVSCINFSMPPRRRMKIPSQFLSDTDQMVGGTIEREKSVMSDLTTAFQARHKGYLDA